MSAVGGWVVEWRVRVQSVLCWLEHAAMLAGGKVAARRCVCAAPQPSSPRPASPSPVSPTCSLHDLHCHGHALAAACHVERALIDAPKRASPQEHQAPVVTRIQKQPSRADEPGGRVSFQLFQLGLQG